MLKGEVKMSINQIVPSGGNAFTIGGAVAGFFTGGPIGAFLGGTAAHYVGAGVRNVADYIRNGTGAIVHSIKEFAGAIKERTCTAIYYLVASIPQWLIMKLENAEVVKNAFASADDAYLAKCRVATYQVDGEAISMALEGLFVPMQGGRAEDRRVIDALFAQSIVAEGLPISKEQLQQRVALGERIFAALGTNEASQVADGYIVLQDADDKKVVIEISVYNTRALMWYFVAQAVKGELTKQKVLKMNQFRPTPADIQAIARECMKLGSFVVPDKTGKVFRFLEKASVKYYDSSDSLLAKDSALRGGDHAIKDRDAKMTLHVIDDASGYLPNGAKRLAINPLRSVEGKGGQRLELKLESFINPSILGPRAEGHEPLAWHMAQEALAIPSKIVASVENLKPENQMQVRVGLEMRRSAFFDKVMDLLDFKNQGENAWMSNRNKALEVMRAMPLHYILPYLIFPNYAETRNSYLKFFFTLSEGERDQLKKMLYQLLQEGIEAQTQAQFARRGNEILIMPHLLGNDNVELYWTKQVTEFQENLFNTLFDATEREVKEKQKNQSVISRWIYGAPLANLESVKQHEEDLFKSGRRAIVHAAVLERRDAEVERIITPPIIMSMAFNGSVHSDTLGQVNPRVKVENQPTLMIDMNALLMSRYMEGERDEDGDLFFDAVAGDIVESDEKAEVKATEDEFDEEGFADALDVDEVENDSDSQQEGGEEELMR